MGRIYIILATAALISLSSGADAFDFLKSTDNQESCIIDGLQSVNNKTAAYAVINRCKSKYRTFRQVGPRNPLGRTGDWKSCVAEYGGSTESNIVANAIRRACISVNRRSLREICADLRPPKPLPEPQRQPEANAPAAAPSPAHTSLFSNLPSPQARYEITLQECRNAGYKD